MKRLTIENMRAALEATKLPPEEHFQRMVEYGLINAKGQLTRLFGGDAEPEPEASGAKDRRPSDDNGEQE
jgi:hypothetical protein